MGNCFGIEVRVRKRSEWMPRRKRNRRKKKEDERAAAEVSPAEEMAVALATEETTPGGWATSTEDDSTLSIDHFVLKKLLRNGNFGEVTVWEAEERASGRKLRIRETSDPFRSYRMAQYAYQEAYFMSQLQHPNIVSLLALFWASDCASVCMVLEVTELDLMAAIKGKTLTPEDKRLITYNLFTAVSYLHAANLVHRDIRPENVLLSSQKVAKLCNFRAMRSLSLWMEEVTELPPLTNHVRRRAAWYQAPEVCAGSHYYTKAVDVWSLGCILMELTTGKLLCYGLDKTHQFFKIVSYFPIPTEEDLESLHSEKMHSLGPKAIVVSNNRHPTVPERMARHASEVAELVVTMMAFNPSKRCKIYEGLSHPYVARYHDPGQEPRPDRDIVPPMGDWNTPVPQQYRDKIQEPWASLDGQFT